ncbi:hypothetical protein DPMN_062074 [Dreissena polymorpha]|uniref:Uncharacterized protein n=1 Tax=Dreissena polymorpha TaxID=45954 RepID=A0A9D4C8T2_DREPO|nr:hypothetical protein DPMN_062074 [Dreissena polymorpha]
MWVSTMFELVMRSYVMARFQRIVKIPPLMKLTKKFICNRIRRCLFKDLEK